MTIRASIPFCLYNLDEREFRVSDDTTIKFSRERIEPSRRTSHSENIEFVQDRWGIEGFSRVEITTSKEFDVSAHDETLLFTLEIINHFISLYRNFYPKAEYLMPLTQSDLIDFNVMGANGRGAAVIQFPGGMTIAMPNVIAEISSAVESALAEKYEVPLWVELLSNAKYYAFVGDNRMATIESVTALEVVLSAFIAEKLMKGGVSHDKAENFIIDSGVSYNLGVMTKVLCSEADFPSELLEKCQGSITRRNKIVHEGRQENNSREVQESLITIREFIEYLVRKVEDPKGMIDKRGDYLSSGNQT